MCLEYCFSYSIFRYAPDNEWFIETMNTVFSLGGDMMHPDLPNSFLKLLSDGEVLPQSRTVVLFQIDWFLTLISCYCGRI